MALNVGSINSLIQNIPLQERHPIQTMADGTTNVVNAILKKKSPLQPQFPAKDYLTTKEICMGADHLLYDLKNGQNPFEVFLQEKSQFGSPDKQETLKILFEARTREEIETNYFSTDQWTWDDLYDKDNLLLCLSSIKLNRKGRMPKFMGKVLSECGCRATKSRNDTDRVIVDKIERNFPHKEEMLKYVSFGSDGCFADWVILSHLILLGYKDVQIHLTHANQNAGQKMKEFFENYPGVKYSVTTHQTFRDFTKVSPKPSDVVLALDFNGDMDSQSPYPKAIVTDTKGFAVITASSTSQAPNWELVGTSGNPLFDRERKKQIVWPKI